MIRYALFGFVAAILASAAPPAMAEPRIGEAAPAFTGTDTAGKSVALADYRGKTVVLEWTNHDCPFVRKHYDSGNMQALQKRWTDAGIVWLTVISSAPGEQGYVSAPAANQLTRQRSAAPSAVVLDPEGRIGQAYRAKTTPHMYIVDATGQLVYMGGIDDKPSTNPRDVKTANNHVDAALSEIRSGKPVSTPATRAYGCSVKYSS